MIFAVMVVAAFLAASLLIYLIVKAYRYWRDEVGRQARQAGYATRGEYLRAVPRSDQEKRDAVDMAVKGLALCVVGSIFPPLILLGILPLFHGARKLAWAQLGLGLVDDAFVDRAKQPGA